MNTINMHAQKKMQKELDNYLSNSSTAKDYSISMKEITAWLTKKAKQ